MTGFTKYFKVRVSYYSKVTFEAFNPLGPS
jgi:hypothetical protein